MAAQYISLEDFLEGPNDMWDPHPDLGIEMK